MVRRLGVVAGLLAGACAVAGATQVPPERLAAARAAVGAFKGALQKEFFAALQGGDRPAAIAVCKERAPQIAAETEQATGWAVRRTAARVRNPQNAPDPWERAVLEEFAARLGRGEALTDLEHAEVVSVGGRSVVRYMKAIPVGAPCLTCHGEAVEPALLETIRASYPEDRATGFRVGELRGAFSLQGPL